MARDFSRDFYNSKEWKTARKAYWQKCGGLCELCLKEGIVAPAEIVHHKIPLSEDNINDPAIRTSEKNLQALCEKHHKMLHGGKGGQRRYIVLSDGTVKF